MNDNTLTPQSPQIPKTLGQIGLKKLLIYFLFFPIVLFILFYKKMPSRKARIIYCLIVGAFVLTLWVINYPFNSSAEVSNTSTPSNVNTKTVSSTSTPSATPTEDQLASYKADVYLSSQDMITANDSITQAGKDAQNYEYTTASNDLDKAIGNFTAAQTILENAKPPENAQHVHSVLLEAVQKFNDATAQMQNGINDQDAQEILNGVNEYQDALPLLDEAKNELSSLN